MTKQDQIERRIGCYMMDTKQVAGTFEDELLQAISLWLGRCLACPTRMFCFVGGLAHAGITQDKLLNMISFMTSNCEQKFNWRVKYERCPQMQQGLTPVTMDFNINKNLKLENNLELKLNY